MCSSVFICPLAFQSKIVKEVHCTVFINYCHSWVCYSMVNLSNVIVITLVKTRMDAYDHDDDVVDDGDDDGIFV